MWTVIGHEKAVALFDGARRLDHLAHAYLLVGPAAVGKKALAMDLARALNCTGPEPPCGVCRSCLRISAGKHSDVRVISLKDDKKAEEGGTRKEIGIDDIKQLQNDASLPPFEGRRKVFIIDGAESMSSAAANCLLKTLEEPPPAVILLLLTAREDRLLLTVVSRCQRVEMLPLPPPVLEGLLQQRGMESGRARLLACLSRGCPGWALTAASDGGFQEQYSRQIDELLSVEEAGPENRFALAARLAVRFAKQREKVEEALDLWVNWWRDVLLVKNGVPDLVTNVDRIEVLRRKAADYSPVVIRDTIVHIRAARKQLESNANPRLVLEVLMLAIPAGGRNSAVV